MDNDIQIPELLAPAGDWDCVRAAVENGADAIYFGLESGFNARARAKNFSVGDLPELMGLLHLRNVKGYVTLNTLAFTSELPDVERLLRAMTEARVDAVLVQDIGVARLAKQICPELALHASTQMTMTSAECMALAEELDIERVVLARELSLDEIKAIRRDSDVPVETFVHGALCVAYSGQCLTSESLGGRSANRGQCAQACRLAYDLIADGRDVDLGEQKYLLSPQDLAAYELTPELLEAGVCSLKIEGRLKTPEYVANITRHYRHAIDAAVARRSLQWSEQTKQEMEMSFSRGFSPGWLHGCDHKMLVPATSSAKRGVLAGSVREVRGNKVVVKLLCSLAAGDGVVFDGDRLQGEEQGGRVFGVYENGTKLDGHAHAGSTVSLTFGPGMLDPGKLMPEQKFWKTDDPKLNQRLRKSYQVSDPVRRVAVDLQVCCRVGEKVTVTARAANKAHCVVTSQHTIEAARQHPINVDVLKEQFGRLGGTVFELRELNAEITGGPMVPYSVLGQLRRELIVQLEACQLGENHQLTAESVLDRMRTACRDMSSVAGKTAATDTLHVLCRTLSQLRAAAEFGVHHLYAEFQDIREYGEAVATAHTNGARLFLATPRIQKPGEMGIFRALAKHGADGMLVRNFSGLQFFHAQRVPVIADFSMNVANELTAEFLIQSGAQRVTASYDLNREQLLSLVEVIPSAWAEIVIHQHMPMFHMEHCVFCAVLSPGTNKHNCGRPCDTMTVELRDRIGMQHPLTADVGCRNTLWNATPQSSAEIVRALQSQGIGNYRIELLRENEQQTRDTVELYQQLLRHEIDGHDVWQKLQASNRVGVTRGTLEDRNPLAII